MRLLGPGSFGIAVPDIGLNATRSHLAPPKGRLALVSQSGALCRAVLDWAEPNGVGFSHIVGLGGNADIGFGMVLDWLSRDPGTGPILLDIRRIKNSRAFLSAARAASRLRPVVAIRAGGRLLDPSGDADRALEGALRRAGVLSVSRFEDLLAAAETLSRAKPLRHEALAILTNAIGPGQLAADAALRDGLPLAQLTPGTIETVRSRLPSGVPITEQGPHYVGFDLPGRLADVAAALGGAPEVGGVLVVHAPLARMIAPQSTAAFACRCSSARWARPPGQRIGMSWRPLASRPLTRPSTPCAGSITWWRRGGAVPRRASCRRVPCSRSLPTERRCATCSLACGGRAGWLSRRRRGWPRWQLTEFRRCRRGWRRTPMRRRRRQCRSAFLPS
jgi:hypothetical protein